jgi:DNA-binding transcriptional ArsR family regulator
MSKPNLPQSGDYHELLRPVTLKGDEALGYAEKSIPVFPCKPGGKEPLIRKCLVAKRQELTGKELAAHARTCERDGHGHHDATTDPERIRAWWSRWPDANVAMPTGKRSGRVVVDEDPEHGGSDSMAELRERGHELPPTTTIKTGGGGRHLYLRYPAGVEIRNSAGKLGPGLDIRGEGGYVIVPPSVTEGPYEVLDNRPPADAPEWLIEALTAPSGVPENDVATIQRAKVPGGGLEGPEIPAGERNTTLYKIACSLRAGGHERGEILEALGRVNRERCSTPLAGEDISKIAKSAAQHAPGNASPEVTAEVLAAVGDIEADIMRRDWPGVGGKSARDTVIALVRLARMHGTMIPAGVRLSVDVRTLALMASVSKSTLLDNTRGGEKRAGAISRLKMRGVIRSDNATRFRKDAGAFVLLTPRANVDHSTTSFDAIEPRGACGPQLRAPLTAPRLRWSRPVFDGLTRVGTISRMGKTKGAVLDYLEAEPSSSLTVAELAEKLGTARVRDLRRRHLDPLEEAGVVECSGDAVSLTANWLDALNERRDQDGEIADHRRDMVRYQRERDAYRNRNKNPPTPHPANRGAHGYVEDLETLPPTPTVEVLYPLVNTTVNTVRGPGRLWQVFSDRVGVVLEGRPEEVTFMHPSELVLGEVAA